MEYKKPEIFICDCGSLDHTFSFWYDEECGEVHFMPRLYQHLSIWKRIGRAFSYIVGKKSRFGDYDSMIIDPEDAYKIKEYLNKVDYISFLSKYPKILKSGLELFKTRESLGKWLIFKEENTPRMIDMNEEFILQKLDDMSRGTYS